MAQRKITIIDGDSAEYWQQRKEGFRLIREAEEAAQRLASAPMYLHGGFDEDGDVIPSKTLARLRNSMRRSGPLRQTRPPSAFSLRSSAPG